MFTTHSPRHSTAMSCVLTTTLRHRTLRRATAIACVPTATLLGPCAAWAQQPSEHSMLSANVRVPVQQDGAPLFAIEMAVYPDGRFRSTIVLLGQDTRMQGGKHCTLQSTVWSWLKPSKWRFTLATQLPQHTADGVLELGELTLTVPVPAASPVGDGGEDEVATFAIVDNAVYLVVDSSSSAADDSDVASLELSFEPGPGEQLEGRPAALFNRPGRDQALVARVPRPAPGKVLDLVLEVSPVPPSERAGTLIPVKVKHNV